MDFEAREPREASEANEASEASETRAAASFVLLCPPDSPLNFSVSQSHAELDWKRVEVTPRHPTSLKRHQDAIPDFAKHVMDSIPRCNNVRELVLSGVAIDLVQLQQLLRLFAERPAPPQSLTLQHVVFVKPSGPIDTSPFLTPHFKSIKLIDNGFPAVLSDILMWVQQVDCLEIQYSSSKGKDRGPSEALKRRAQEQGIKVAKFKASTKDLCWLDMFDPIELSDLVLRTPRGKPEGAKPNTIISFPSLTANFCTKELLESREVLKKLRNLQLFAIYAHIDDFCRTHTEDIRLSWPWVKQLGSYFMQVTLDTKKIFTNPLRGVKELCYNHYIDAVQCNTREGFTFRCAEFPSDEDSSGYRSLSRHVNLAERLRDRGTDAWEVVHNTEWTYVYNLNVNLRNWLEQALGLIMSHKREGWAMIKFEAQYVDFGKGIYGSYKKPGSMMLMISPQQRSRLDLQKKEKSSRIRM